MFDRRADAAMFEFLYFLKFEADIHEPSGFCYIQYGESIYGPCVFI